MRILLAHDGSTAAAEAAHLVRGLALPAGSSIRIVSVIEPTMVALTAWAGGIADASADADGDLAEHYEGELGETVERLGAADRNVASVVLRGRPATAIVDEARTFGADLIVVGSRGLGELGSLLLGSVSSEVVDHAPCPVLVARRSTVSRIVLATDGSPSAAAAERVAASWSIFDGVPVRVVSAADVPRPWHTGIAPTMYGRVMEAYARDLEEAKDEHAGIAAETVARLAAAGRDATAETPAGDAAAEIVGAAADWGADLIVLGSRGRTGLTRLLLGSVARNVVHGSEASVLVVHDIARTGDGR